MNSGYRTYHQRLPRCPYGATAIIKFAVIMLRKTAKNLENEATSAPAYPGNGQNLWRVPYVYQTNRVYLEDSLLPTPLRFARNNLWRFSLRDIREGAQGVSSQQRKRRARQKQAL